MSYVGRLESAQSAPRIDLVGRIDVALGISPEELTAGGDEREAPTGLRTRDRELAETLVSEAGEDTLRTLSLLSAWPMDRSVGAGSGADVQRSADGALASQSESAPIDCTC